MRYDHVMLHKRRGTNLKGGYSDYPFQSFSGSTSFPVTTVLNSLEEHGHIYNRSA
jgi:hypothetical protein